MIKTWSPVTCLFKAKLNAAEWEEGGVASDPHSSLGPGGRSFIPSHMSMQPGDQGEIMRGRGERQGQQETRSAYRNIMALSRFFKHVETLQDVELRGSENWVCWQRVWLGIWVYYLLFVSPSECLSLYFSISASLSACLSVSVSAISKFLIPASCC